MALAAEARARTRSPSLKSEKRMMSLSGRLGGSAPVAPTALCERDMSTDAAVCVAKCEKNSAGSRSGRTAATSA